MVRAFLFLFAGVMYQMEPPAITVEGRPTFYSHAQLVAAAGSEADGATLVAESIRRFVAVVPQAEVAVVSEQLPGSWLPAMNLVRFRRLAGTELSDAMKACRDILQIRQISRDDREALVILARGTSCGGTERNLRYLRRPGGWQLESGPGSGTWWGASHCTCG